MIIGILYESYILCKQMAPYLLFGFLFAGILHIFLKPETIARHLGHNNFGAVLKASLFGIPLPLCSCGVIPAALSLRKEGASKGATLSFLISTPTTGVDSILATFALLGGFFAIYRVLVSFFAALLVGLAANLLIPDTHAYAKETKSECKCCGGTHKECAHGIGDKIKGVFTYAFDTLLHDAAGWLFAGLVIGGIISYVTPDDFIHNYVGGGLPAILLMLIIGIPMYICSSGSIPIAAALMLKGLNPGAAFAFLVAGPATNTVTMAVVLKQLGKGALTLYLFSIAVSSIVFGLVLDFLWHMDAVAPFHHHAHAPLFPAWFEGACAIFLFIMIVRSMGKKLFFRRLPREEKK